MNFALVNPAKKVFPVFFISLLVSFAGLCAGQFVPAAMWIPLVVLEFVLLISVFFARKKKAMGYSLMYAFVLISGATLYPTIVHYANAYGADLVLKAFAIAAFAYAGIAIYAMKTKEDFSFLGGFLFSGLLVLIGVAILGFFFPLTGMMELIVSGFGILIFIGYTLYDFNKMARHGVTEDEIPLTVLNLYLDFINLFLYILRFMGASSKD